MTEKRHIPAFHSEAEEARWWFENREARDEEFAQAIVEGRAGKNTLAARVAKSRATASASPVPASAPQPAKHR
jgi:hypothetical protein